MFGCMYRALIGGLRLGAHAALLACVGGLTFLMRACLRWDYPLVSDCLCIPHHHVSLQHTQGPTTDPVQQLTMERHYDMRPACALTVSDSQQMYTSGAHTVRPLPQLAGMNACMPALVCKQHFRQQHRTTSPHSLSRFSPNTKNSSLHTDGPQKGRSHCAAICGSSLSPAGTEQRAQV